MELPDSLYTSFLIDLDRLPAVIKKLVITVAAMPCPLSIWMQTTGQVRARVEKTCGS